MGEKKEIKVSLGTVMCLFIIIVLIIALGLVYYLGFIKNEEIPPVPEKNNGISATQQNIVTLAFGVYRGNTMDDDIDFSDTMWSSANEFQVTLKEDNTCDIYEGVGNTNLGTYKIEGNKLICHTVICRAEEGPLSYFEENVVFEYEIINKTTIKLVKISGSDSDIYAKKIGRTFTFDENNNDEPNQSNGDNIYKELTSNLGQNEMFGLININKNTDGTYTLYGGIYEITDSFSAELANEVYKKVIVSGDTKYIDYYGNETTIKEVYNESFPREDNELSAKISANSTWLLNFEFSNSKCTLIRETNLAT